MYSSLPEFNISTEKELIDCLEYLKLQCIKLAGNSLIVDRVFEYWNIFKNSVYLDFNKKLKIPNISFDPRFFTDSLIITLYWKNEEEYLGCEILENGYFKFIYTSKTLRKSKKERLEIEHNPGENLFTEKILELLYKFTERKNNGY